MYYTLVVRRSIFHNLKKVLLDDDGITRYRMCIGCINWAVTIGRFDAMFAAITMARYSAVPREGHLNVALRIIGYLKYHAKGAIRMIVEKPKFELENESDIAAIKWKEKYPEAKEKIPLHYPIPKGKSVLTWLE